MNIIEKTYLKTPRSIFFLFMVFSPMIIYIFLENVFNSSETLGPLIISIIYLGWFYVLGTNLYDKVSGKIKLSKSIFEFNILYSILFITTMLFLVEFKLVSNISGTNPFIFPFAFYNLIALAYTIYFIAKALSYFTYNDASDKHGITGIMSLLFLFPIGIIVLQPKINRIFKNDWGIIFNYITSWYLND